MKGNPTRTVKSLNLLKLNQMCGVARQVIMKQIRSEVLNIIEIILEPTRKSLTTEEGKKMM